IAIASGVICGAIVFAYCIAIDQYRAAAVNGGTTPAAPRRTFVKQLESLLRPVSRLPARTAIQVRQKLSQAGNPGGLTPAGFQSVRYSVAAIMAVAGLAVGLVVPVGMPTLLAAAVSGLIFAVIGCMTPALGIEQRIAQR